MLEPNEVLDVLNLTVKPNDEPGKKEFKKMEVNARARIVQSLSYSIMESIKDKTYKGRYEYNWENFYKNWLVTQVKHQSQLRNLSYRESATCFLTSIFNKVWKYCIWSQGSWGKIDKKETVKQFLSSIPIAYKSVTLVTYLEATPRM